MTIVLFNSTAYMEHVKQDTAVIVVDESAAAATAEVCVSCTR